MIFIENIEFIEEYIIKYGIKCTPNFFFDSLDDCDENKCRCIKDEECNTEEDCSTYEDDELM